MTVQPVTTTQNLTADRSWLASLHGTGDIDTVTLDLSTFTAGTHYFASTDTTVVATIVTEHTHRLLRKNRENGVTGEVQAST